MLTGYRNYLTKSNALSLAVGVIIGAAVGKVVDSLAKDILMPLIGLLLPGGDWRTAEVVLSRSTDAAGKEVVNAIRYGNFLAVSVDFLIISFIVYLLMRVLLRQDMPG